MEPYFFDFIILNALNYLIFFTCSPFYGPADGRYPTSFRKRFSMQLNGLNRFVDSIENDLNEAMLTDKLIKSMLCGFRTKQGLQKPHPSIKCY